MANPKKDDSERRSVSVGVTLTEDERDWLGGYAERTGATVSSAVRAIIRREREKDEAAR